MARSAALETQIVAFGAFGTVFDTWLHDNPLAAQVGVVHLVHGPLGLVGSVLLDEGLVLVQFDLVDFAEPAEVVFNVLLRHFLGDASDVDLLVPLVPVGVEPVVSVVSAVVSPGVPSDFLGVLPAPVVSLVVSFASVVSAEPFPFPVPVAVSVAVLISVGVSFPVSFAHFGGTSVGAGGTFSF